MTTKLKPLTIADWDAMPYRDGNRYEIIEGELFVSCSPGLTHEQVLFNLIIAIGTFLDQNPVGVGVGNVGVVLSDVSGVIPDLVFFRNDQRDTIVKNDRLHGPPALVAEILSPGSTNIRRDRVTKLQLYDKHEVPEYWIVDPRNKTLERYVRQSSSLNLRETFHQDDTLTTTALPGFSCQMSYIFKDRT
jgi:Uma2 family endonuclease